jgi:DNA-binding PadR family transcriptional regulator
VTLALIGDGGASPQDLVDMNRRGGEIYYAVAPSRLYAEPKRLEQLGYVRSEKRPGKTRERSFYTLTPKGRKALRRWVTEPPALPRIQNEAVPKLISGDVLDDDRQLLDTLLTLRHELDGQQAKLDQGRANLETLPHRRKYLLLVHELGGRLIEAQREWLDDVERELRRSD